MAENAGTKARKSTSKSSSKSAPKPAERESGEQNVSDPVAAAANPPETGRLLSSCRIELPPGDVVEEIEYEKFFLLNEHFGDLRETPDEPAPTIKLAAPREPKKGTDGEQMIDDDVMKLEMAIYMPFLQQWKLEGYTRGRIVNSFSLGPGEEQTVELFTWAKSTSSLTSATSFDSEQTTESSGTRHDALDVSRDVARQTGFEMTSDAKVGFTAGEVVNVNIGAGTSARAGLNEGEKETRQAIVDATSRSTGTIRTSRTLTVTETQDAGREERVTRKLTNPNSCHTLTVPFFEVLSNYQVSTAVRASEVRIVALIDSPTPDEDFDRDFIRSHESTLRLALLDRSLADGFDAARLLEARKQACGVLCQSCSCGNEGGGGTDGVKWDAVVTTARDVATAATAIQGKFVRFPFSVREVALPPFGIGVIPQVRAPGIKDVKSYLFKRALAANAPRLVTDLLATGIAPDPLLPVTATQVQALERAIGALPPPASALLRFDPRVADGVGWEMYAYVLTFVPEFITAGIVTQQVKDLVGMGQFEDEGLMDALARFGAAYEDWNKEQEAERAGDKEHQEMDRIAKEERNLRILEAFGLRETADAEERYAALLAHLNDPKNRDHYRFAVWNERSGPADPRLTGLARAGVTEGAPVGIVGSKLAVPIRLTGKPKWESLFKESMSDLLKSTTQDVRRHILPTAALYSEAVVGGCVACEPSIVRTKQLEADATRLSNDALRLENERLEGRLEKKLFDKELPPQNGFYVSVNGHQNGDHGASEADDTPA